MLLGIAAGQGSSGDRAGLGTRSVDLVDRNIQVVFAPEDFVGKSQLLVYRGDNGLQRYLSSSSLTALFLFEFKGTITIQR